MQSSPTSRHFLPRRSKYSPQHSVSIYAQSMFLPNATDQVSHHRENRYNYDFVYFNVYVFREETEDRKL
jgi:hypothetical protein